jgi:hypothetical protein
LPAYARYRCPHRGHMVQGTAHQAPSPEPIVRRPSFRRPSIHKPSRWFLPPSRQVQAVKVRTGRNKVTCVVCLFLPIKAASFPSASRPTAGTRQGGAKVRTSTGRRCSRVQIPRLTYRKPARRRQAARRARAPAMATVDARAGAVPPYGGGARMDCMLAASAV